MRQAHLTRAILLLLAVSSGPWAIRTRRSSRRRRFERRIAPRLPRGLVQRVAGQEDLCPENDCTYQYLNDATGNCVGVVCAGGGSVGGSCSSANLYAVRFSRMDAWGNLISPVYLDGLPPALPVDDVDCTASTAEGCEPADGMPQEEVLAGPYQYHGSDRYETDLIDMDKLLRPDGGQPAPGAGRSTGFVHVGVRYYEPATGRFLQHDPMFIDPTPFAWGQHNRWVYCANDPVNYRDDCGQALVAILAAIGAVIGAGYAYYNGGDASDILLGAFLGAMVGALAGLGITALLAVGASAGTVATVAARGVQIITCGGVQWLVLNGQRIGQVLDQVRYPNGETLIRFVDSVGKISTIAVRDSMWIP